MRAVIAGHGFLGSQIAAVLAAAGYENTVIRRTAGAGLNSGIKFVAADLMQAAPSLTDSSFDVAVFCLAPGRRDAGLYHQTYVTAQQNFLGGISPVSYIYISSTGVYPDLPGTYSEIQGSPHSDRARILLEAEAVALQFSGAAVLRLAGLYSAERPIYGSERASYREDKLVHFIHKDDAARAVLHAVTEKLSGVYNVHDGHPLRRSQILPLPDAEALPASFAPRIISADKFFATGYRPLFTDYQNGIAGLSASGLRRD